MEREEFGSRVEEMGGFRHIAGICRKHRHVFGTCRNGWRKSTRLSDVSMVATCQAGSPDSSS